MRTAESVVLTLCPPGPLARNTSIWRSLSSICDLDLVGLGQHEHGGRRRVDASLALGDRHPLHPVRPALVLEAWPRPVALHREGDLVDAAEVAAVQRQRVHLEPVARRVRPVHVVQVAGEQVGLLAALGAADLDDHVPPSVRVRGDHQLAQLLVDAVQGGERGPELLLHGRPLVPDRLGEQLLRRLGVCCQRTAAPRRVDERVELAVAGGDPAQLGRVGGDGRVGQAGLEVGVLLLHGGEAGGHGGGGVGHGPARLHRRYRSRPSRFPEL